mmetsp:Transcript_112965/g.364945  ORF Transcript_112965/g.364945 Transcript_112965/m.364945 type:complete len:84 (-) Transcript_112965:660-911(-)
MVALEENAPDGTTDAIVLDTVIRVPVSGVDTIGGPMVARNCGPAEANLGVATADNAGATSTPTSWGKAMSRDTESARFNASVT